MRLADVPIARMFVLAGIVFLLVAVMGKIEGKIEPGQIGRIGASILGVILMGIGVAMQYEEMNEMRQERLAVLQQTAVAAVTANSGAPDNHAIPGVGKVAIRIITGNYGGNCNGKPGNATTSIAAACDGKQACDYAVEKVGSDGEYSASCARDFSVQWKCAGDTIYTAVLPADAVSKGEKLHVACAE